MIRFKPFLKVSRLVVRKGASIAYDQRFSSGVNVIRGDNSSGKSTILNFIFYVLGGDLSDWSDEALRCNDVYAEVELNNVIVTLKREVTQSPGAYMDFFSGSYEAAREAPLDSWERYPYSRSKNKESFSQVLFRLLGMPDVAVETTASITMHQMLRLLYADQLSPVDELFRAESYDPADLREAIGNLLVGAYDNKIYEKQKDLKSVNKKYDEVASELRSLLVILGVTASTGTKSWLDAEKKKIEDSRAQLLNEIEESEQALIRNVEQERAEIDAREPLFVILRGAQKAYDEKQSEREALLFEISDSAEFIASLENKLTALQDSEVSAETFGEPSFSSCPACHAELISAAETLGSCRLCKTPLDTERAKGRIAALINDAALQLRQSKKLQEGRHSRLIEIEREVEQLSAVYRDASAELGSLTGIPTSRARVELNALHRKLGALDEELASFQEKYLLAQRLEDLSAEKAELASLSDEIESDIQARIGAQRTRRAKAYSAIENGIIELLKRDLKRQDSFEDPKSVQFSFRKNYIMVDDQKYISASSRVVLKVAFFVSFLIASMKNEFFRQPRFLIIDITEDKGMEVRRTQNLQNLILKASENSEVEHQIILATSMPSESIPESAFIGPHYTGDFGTLRL